MRGGQPNLLSKNSFPWFGTFSAYQTLLKPAEHNKSLIITIQEFSHWVKHISLYMFFLNTIFRI